MRRSTSRCVLPSLFNPGRRIDPVLAVLQTLSQHYIGLHNEATHKKTATTGAFVCFKPATISGGECS